MDKEPQQHPPQNSTILEQLFRTAHIECKDLKNVRLVCRAWNEKSLPLWRKAVVLTLIEAHAFSPAPCPGIHPKDFLAELHNSESILRLRETPYEKYKLFGLTLEMDYLENNAEATAFWSAVGPFVKHLTLENVKWVGVRNAASYRSRLFRFFRQRMPQLKHLSLISVNFPHDFFYEYRPKEEIGLPDLTSLSLTNTQAFYLSDFPNLKSLRLADSADFLFKSRSTCSDMDRPPQDTNSSVTRMELRLLDSNSVVLDLRFTALEHFEIIIKDYQHYSNYLGIRSRGNNFLRALPANLKTCNVIQCKPLYTPTDAPFTTELPNLTEVRLWGSVVPDLSFVRYMPNLKLLHVDVLNYGRQKEMWQTTPFLSREPAERDLVEGAMAKGVMAGVTLPHLTSLFLNCQLSPGSVQALREWMPNVSEFKAVLNPATLLIVLGQWSGLRLTSIHCLIGSCLKDTDLSTLTQWMNNLESFRYDSVCNGSGFKNAQVFLELPGLLSLKLCVSHRFSEETEALLKEKIQHVQIYRNYSTNPNHKNWKCCRFGKFVRRGIDFSDAGRVQGYRAPLNVDIPWMNLNQ